LAQPNGLPLSRIESRLRDSAGFTNAPGAYAVAASDVLSRTARLFSTAYTEDEVAAGLGTDLSTIYGRRRARTLWAIEDAAAWVYPVLQFRPGTFLEQTPCLDAVLSSLAEDLHPAAVAGFLETPQCDLQVAGSACTVIDWLLDGGDVERVLSLITLRIWRDVCPSEHTERLLAGLWPAALVDWLTLPLYTALPIPDGQFSMSSRSGIVVLPKCQSVAGDSSPCSIAILLAGSSQQSAGAAMMDGNGDFDHLLKDAADQLVLATRLCAFAAQGTSRRRAWEHGDAIAALDKLWGTAELPDPVTVYQRVFRAFLEGIGDLLTGLALSLQAGSPLLVSTATLARSVHEYSSRTAFLTDPDLPVDERLCRAALMINDGFDHAGGKDPTVAGQVKTTATPFYDWYHARGRDLTGRAKKFSKYVRSAEIFAKTLGSAYQEPVYKDLSNFAHGNGPTVLSLFDASTRPDVDGPGWNAINAFGRVFYALDCAMVAIRQVGYFADPSDQRLLSEILPYSAGAIGLGDLRPAALAAEAESRTRLALGQWRRCIGILEQARDVEK